MSVDQQKEREARRLVVEAGLLVEDVDKSYLQIAHEFGLIPMKESLEVQHVPDESE